jgi:hypothetical protein
MVLIKGQPSPTPTVTVTVAPTPTPTPTITKEFVTQFPLFSPFFLQEGPIVDAADQVIQTPTVTLVIAPPSVVVATTAGTSITYSGASDASGGSGPSGPFHPHATLVPELFFHSLILCY